MNEYKETTIYIYSKPDDPLRYVRCLEDGNLLMEIKGQIVYVIIGAGQPHKIIKISATYMRVKCKRCNTYYSILVQNI